LYYSAYEKKSHLKKCYDQSTLVKKYHVLFIKVKLQADGETS